MSAAWEGVPTPTLNALERQTFGQEIPGVDIPLANGCWKCIGCGVILPRSRHWNQCSECDTREPEDKPRFGGVPSSRIQPSSEDA